MQKATEKQLIQYQPEISNELNNYDLTEFTPILIAIMDQESLGKGNDQCNLLSLLVLREMKLKIFISVSNKVFTIFPKCISTYKTASRFKYYYTKL